ncbi:hypothetical protein WP9W18E04_29960 [Aeromonas veronii]|nr:hypothetical protein WP9W18E04_29960 [Aeromonas veronii]
MEPLIIFHLSAMIVPPLTAIAVMTIVVVGL